MIVIAFAFVPVATVASGDGERGPAQFSAPAVYIRRVDPCVLALKLHMGPPISGADGDCSGQSASIPDKHSPNHNPVLTVRQISDSATMAVLSLVRH